jgi:hypothetical protein
LVDSTGQNRTGLVTSGEEVDADGCEVQGAVQGSTKQYRVSVENMVNIETLGRC